MTKRSRKQKSVPQNRPAKQARQSVETSAKAARPSDAISSPPGHRKQKRIALLGSLLLLIALASFFGWNLYRKYLYVPDLKYSGYNLLFVTIDTLRADHVGAYGYKNIKTPNLDHLGSKGYLFKRAVSQIPLTLPSHTSIFTGTFPVYHGVRDNGGYFVPPQSLTLAEILKQHGYKTAAFVSSFILDSKWGLDQGFDTYYDDFDMTKADETSIGDVQRPGGETNAVALKWLADASSPFFAWVHYYDPHDPYEPPEPFRSEYPERPYDGEIAYTDSLLGQLLRVLESRKLMEKTLIVVTGDHGEGLGQHHELNHALFIYDTTLHVPLIIKTPNGVGEEISQTVEHVDVAPTILDLLQIQKPQTLQGRSLIPLMKHQKMNETMAFSESLYAEKHYGWSPLISVTTDKFKFIQAPRPELYNLQDDPSETKNLYASLPGMAKTLQDRAGELLQKYSPSSSEQKAAAQIDAESQETLRALGYIGSGPSEKMKEQGKNIDPKDKIELVEALHAAFRAMQQNNLDNADADVAKIITEDPEIVDAYLLKGMVASKRENYPLAVSAFQQTLSLRPDHLIALFNLALVYSKSGQPQKAIEGFKEVLRKDPHYLKAMVNLAQTYIAQNQPEEAMVYYRQAIDRYKEMLKSSTTVDSIVSIHEALSGVYFGQGKIDEAEAEIKEIIRLKPGHSDAHYNLAQIYEKRGALKQAVEEYNEEIRYNPSNFKAYNDLALLLRQTDHQAEAVPVLQRAVQLNPSNFGVCFMLADSLLQTGGNLQEARQFAERAVQMNPSFQRAHDLLAEINRRIGG
jgi:arylsulfatase A-like enzyme/Tfp pilus assembly protein PilF